MSSAHAPPLESANTLDVLRAQLNVLEAQNKALNTQLDWFKRQLFGRKSEKRLHIDPALQADLLAGLKETDPQAPLPPE